MATQDTVIAEIEALIAGRRDELLRIERRIATAQEARDVTRRDLDALERTLELYRLEHNIPSVTTDEMDSLAVELQNVSPKDLIVEYARLRGGRLKVHEAAQVLTQLGKYKDVRNASSNLFAAISRSGDLFRKIKRGEYELVSPVERATSSQEEPETGGELDEEIPASAEPTPFPPMLNSIYPNERLAPGELSHARSLGVGRLVPQPPSTRLDDSPLRSLSV